MVRLTESHDMTIVVDWDVKPPNKQTRMDECTRQIWVMDRPQIVVESL